MFWTRHPTGYTRIYIPYLVDVVIVWKSALLRKVARHKHIGRPDQTGLPWPFSWLVRATQFFAPREAGAHYAVAFTSTDCNEQKMRRWRVYDNLPEAFSAAQLDKLREIVNSDMDREQAAKEITNVVGPAVLNLDVGEKIPDCVLDYVAQMDLQRILVPWCHLKARRARQKILEWANEVCEEDHAVDVLHDLVTLYHGFTAGLLGLRRIEGRDLKTHMVNHPVLPFSFRVVTEDTNVNGAFDSVLRKGKTAVILSNGAAATESKDFSFVFGMGIESRQCPFKRLFMETGESILEGESNGLAPNRSVGEVIREG